jgi:membrane protein implicated in regulation of membrane protease activity
VKKLLRKRQQLSYQLFPQPEIGIVEVAIAPNQPGRIAYKASSYPAKLYNCNSQLLPNTKVAVIGRENITLLIQLLADSN